MAIVTRTVVLTGGRAGQTCRLNHGRFQFTQGKLVLRGEGDTVAALMKILATQYQAYELGSDELEAANGKRDFQEAETGQEPVLGGVQPSGAGTSEEAPGNVGGSDGTETDPGEERVPAEGNGHADPRLDRIRIATERLDVGKDAHWTQDGFPKVKVVAGMAKLDDVTRADIDKAAPGFKR